MDPALVSAFGIWLPVQLLNVFWICQIVLGAIVLRQGRWNRQTRWAELGVGIFGSVCFWLVFVNFDPEAARYREVALAFAGTIRILLGTMAAASIVPVVSRAYRIARQRWGI